MKTILLLLCVAMAARSYAVDPLTDAEKKHLAEVETAAKRTPDIRAKSAEFSAARKAFSDDRKKFPAERDPAVAKSYRKAQANYEDAVAKAMIARDPAVEPLLKRKAELSKLGLLKANEGETVADSDSSKNDAMKPIKDETGLPRVLLVGDSVSIGYTQAVRAKLKGRANVHRIPQNGGATEVGLEKMKSWLGDGKWDVIHFNFGLHDAKFASETKQRASRDEYAANLRTLIAQMKATGANLIFATTTPVPKDGNLSPGRRFDSIPERNKIAARVMEENGVAIDDLYAVMLPQMEKLGRPNDVHFSTDGYEVLATAVAASIEKALKP